MRVPHVAAFVATVALAVPAGWHALDADIQKDGPGTRPAEQEILVDNATVKVQLDRTVMMAGTSIKATLVATSELEHDVYLDVRALQDNGYGGERVPRPPTVVGKKRIKVHATPDGGAPTEVAFALNGSKRKGAVAWYSLDVLKAKAKFKPNDWDNTEYDENGDAIDTQATSARVAFATWGGNSFPIAFDPITVPPKGPFQVAVRVKNTTKHAFDWVDVTLGQRVQGGGLDSNMYFSGYEGDGSDYTVEQVKEDKSDEDPTVAAGAERVFKFTITPTNDDVKQFTFATHADAGKDGALEIITVQRGEAAPSIVGLAVAK